MEIILQIISFFLNPTKHELACRTVGKLVIAGMKALGDHLMPHIDTVLKDVLTKMHTAYVRVIDDSLIIVFIYSFYNHYESTVSLLNVIPGPDGGSALEFVFLHWLKKYASIHSRYEKHLK